MVASMTGYGKSVNRFKNKIISVEIQSINSKFLDLNIRIPVFFKEKEMELRNFLGMHLERGRVDLNVTVEINQIQAAPVINKKFARHYFKELKSISNELKLANTDYLRILLQLPNVIEKEEKNIDKNQWLQTMKGITVALNQLQRFRKKEGVVLYKDIAKRITEIQKCIKKIEVIEPYRIKTIKNKLRNNLTEFVGKEKVNEDRFEQEVIYYLEKIDFTEEKIRLTGHCSFFLKTLEEKTSNGKKLGFITQEIGREINTLGNKANDLEIQKIVVNMKDELEKIKEQIMNIQ